MNSYCKRLRKRLAEKGPRGIQNDVKALEHLEGCADCFEFLEAFSDIDRRIHDAALEEVPDELVDRVLGQVRAAPRPDGEEIKKTGIVNKARFIGRFIRWLRLPRITPRRLGFAISLVIMLGVAVLWITPPSLMVRRVAQMELTADGEYDRRDQTAGQSGKYRARSRMAAKKQKPGMSLPRRETAAVPEKKSTTETEAFEEAELEAPMELVKEEPRPAAEPAEPSVVEPRGPADTSMGKDMKESKESLSFGLDPSQDLNRRDMPDPDMEDRMVYFMDADTGVTDRETGTRSSLSPDDELRSFSDTRPAKPESKADRDGGDVNMKFESEDRASGSGSLGGAELKSPRADQQQKLGRMLLGQFLRERSTVQGLSFQEASDYWTNTYVPGDPAFRWLHSRLENWDRSGLAKYVGSGTGLDQAARQNRQPFDPPDNAAIGVFLHADRAGLTGKNRLLVQVGLQGTSRRSGSRAAMNVGVVLDLRGSRTGESGKKIRALLEAFSRARDIGDRFSLTVAGPYGGMLVEPKHFRYGYLTVTLDNLFKKTGPKRERLGLLQALKLSIESVAENDDPASPLGSSAVILVTDQALGTLAHPVSELAHQSAVSGIPVSMVGIGEKVNIEEIDRIVLNGQGNRRLLSLAKEADSLVARELSAASRIIARAVRLRIRLAGGVKLVDVLGSGKLDAGAARKVRDAEKSIDLRMARNLGITTDRGEDEDGIQIVIPAFFAGDSHVILLDVVAPGPGEIADVTVKYKDLIKLKNGVTRANLSLARGTGPAGPLERNVLKNLMAFNLYKTLVRAGEDLEAGNDASAVWLTQKHLALLSAARMHLPGFTRDPDIIDDIRLVEGFHSVLTGSAVHLREHRTYIADSLKLAGRLKILPRPVDNH